MSTIRCTVDAFYLYRPDDIIASNSSHNITRMINLCQPYDAVFMCFLFIVHTIYFNQQVNNHRPDDIISSNSSHNITRMINLCQPYDAVSMCFLFIVHTIYFNQQVNNHRPDDIISSNG